MAGITFSTRGSGAKIWQKLHFLSEIANFEIHLQQQIHDISKERLKNDYWVLYNSTLILISQNQNCNALSFGY